jgi:hypothetical protein
MTQHPNDVVISVLARDLVQEIEHRESLGTDNLPLVGVVRYGPFLLMLAHGEAADDLERTVQSEYDLDPADGGEET